MKAHFDCIPCLIRQALDTSRALGLDDATIDRVLRETLGLARELDWDAPPPVIARDIHRIIRRETGEPDPYLRQKIADTEKALALLPEVEEIIAATGDPLLAAVKFSIAGNAIDLGAKTGQAPDVQEVVHHALGRPLDEANLGRLGEAIAAAGSVLFLADNAGEIVFDRPLLELIGRDKVTAAVRGAPVINDATMDDACRSGLVGRFWVISNGSDTPGTWLEDCSSAFVQAFANADLVIAKGQGNYESLSFGDSPRKVFFLFLTKCAVVAGDMGQPLNTYVIHES